MERKAYNPTLGRFMQTDPVGYKDDVDLYTYTHNDPIDGTDPTGQCWPACTILVGAAMPSSGQLVLQGAAAATGAIVGGATGSAAEAAMGAKAAESIPGSLSSAAVSEVAGDATEHNVSSIFAQPAATLANIVR